MKIDFIYYIENPGNVLSPFLHYTVLFSQITHRKIKEKLQLSKTSENNFNFNVKAVVLHVCCIRISVLGYTDYIMLS